MARYDKGVVTVMLAGLVPEPPDRKVLLNKSILTTSFQLPEDDTYRARGGSKTFVDRNHLATKPRAQKYQGQ